MPVQAISGNLRVGSSEAAMLARFLEAALQPPPAHVAERSRLLARAERLAGSAHATVHDRAVKRPDEIDVVVAGSGACAGGPLPLLACPLLARGANTRVGSCELRHLIWRPRACCSPVQAIPSVLSAHSCCNGTTRAGLEGTVDCGLSLASLQPRASAPAVGLLTPLRSAAGFLSLYFLGVHSVLSRLTRCARFAGASSGGQAPLELLLAGEAATLDAYLAHGAVCGQATAVRAVWAADRHWRAWGDALVEAHADRLPEIDGVCYVSVTHLGWRGVTNTVYSRFGGNPTLAKEVRGSRPDPMGQGGREVDRECSWAGRRPKT